MPHKAGRLIGITLLGAAGVVIAVVAAGLGFRAYRQHLAAETLSIDSLIGVQEGGFVEVGGIKQWVQIRGEDRDNPVLLFVHGGPGGTTLPISSAWRPWEKHFTVVQWDQRGTGRTYGAAGDMLAPTMTLERMTQDGIELTEYLRTHLHKDRIVLVGHSWGSFLGIHMAKQRPDLFYAYVGTGQVVGRATFEKAFELTIGRLQTRAATAGNTEALAELASVAARPTITPENRLIVEKWSSAFALPPADSLQPAGPIPPLFMPDFSLLDWYNWRKGAAFSTKYLTGRDGPMFRHDIASIGFEYSIPMFFIEGDADGVTPGGARRAIFQPDQCPA
ncbi:alpha/beta fold hydrolase [Bradyrhizobium frederickii]|uniref:alpha/beta fold hydrolase n=1 Tax=Bradyrhizobium frederickii TaxID=2560054 RepID=UPI001F29F69A|nr:alpha/beta hydrolase [Bradyrhizobium frederickii]